MASSAAWTIAVNSGSSLKWFKSSRSSLPPELVLDLLWRSGVLSRVGEFRCDCSILLRCPAWLPANMTSGRRWLCCPPPVPTLTTGLKGGGGGVGSRSATLCSSCGGRSELVWRRSDCVELIPLLCWFVFIGVWVVRLWWRLKQRLFSRWYAGWYYTQLYDNFRHVLGYNYNITRWKNDIIRESSSRIFLTHKKNTPVKCFYLQ